MANIAQQNPVVGTSAVVPGNPQVITVQPQLEEANLRLKNRITLYGLGIMEIFFGSVSIVLGITTFSISSHDSIPHGIWCGAILVASGILGVIAKGTPSVCVYNGNLVLSIIAACAMLPLVVFSCVTASHFNPFSSFPPLAATLVTLYSVLAMFGFIAGIFCIVHSAYCCNSLACCQSQQRYTAPVILFPQSYGMQQPEQMMVQLANGQFVMVPGQPVTAGCPSAPTVAGYMHGASAGQQIAVPPEDVSTRLVTPEHSKYQDQSASGGYAPLYNVSIG